MLYQEDVLTFCCQFKKLFVKTFSDYLDLIDGGFSSGHNWGILGGHPGIKGIFEIIIMNITVTDMRVIVAIQMERGKRSSAHSAVNRFYLPTAVIGGIFQSNAG